MFLKVTFDTSVEMLTNLTLLIQKLQQIADLGIRQDKCLNRFIIMHYKNLHKEDPFYK